MLGGKHVQGIGKMPVQPLRVAGMQLSQPCGRVGQQLQFVATKGGLIFTVCMLECKVTGIPGANRHAVLGVHHLCVTLGEHSIPCTGGKALLMDANGASVKNEKSPSK